MTETIEEIADRVASYYANMPGAPYEKSMLAPLLRGVLADRSLMLGALSAQRGGEKHSLVFVCCKKGTREPCSFHVTARTDRPEEHSHPSHEAKPFYLVPTGTGP